jgi:alanine-glyoxylate transaminase / serine-glyoxylate transaminase / serine-pyruvate transaminase
MLNPPKRLLFGPGPTMIEPRVYEALSKPIVGHLDPYFFEVVNDVRAGLREVFGTRNPFTYAISGTGSAGMETAIANFVEPGTKLAVLANGFFCDRITEMGRRHGADVVRLEKPWGETFRDDEVTDFIHRERPQLVAFVQAETSTGVFTEGKTICAAAHDADALVIADTVTSLGGVPVQVDANGIDIAYSCTQKGLSCTPGLAPITVSPRALDRLRARKRPVETWYVDLKLIEDYYDGHKYHHTASATLFYALAEALTAVREEGVERRWERHYRNHRALVAGFEAMGLEMLAPAPCRLRTLNTPRVPQGVDDAKVRKYLLEEEGIEIAGGFGPLAGKIFRVGLMGPMATEDNVAMFLEAFERALQASGAEAPRPSFVR